MSAPAASAQVPSIEVNPSAPTANASHSAPQPDEAAPTAAIKADKPTAAVTDNVRDTASEPAGKFMSFGFIKRSTNGPSIFSRLLASLSKRPASPEVEAQVEEPTSLALPKSESSDQTVAEINPAEAEAATFQATKSKEPADKPFQETKSNPLPSSGNGDVKAGRRLSLKPKLPSVPTGLFSRSKKSTPTEETHKKLKVDKVGTILGAAEAQDRQSNAPAENHSDGELEAAKQIVKAKETTHADATVAIAVSTKSA